MTDGRPLFCIVATFDNVDPQCFGPFSSPTQAHDAADQLRAAYSVANNTHLEAVTVRVLRPMSEVVRG